MNGPSDPAVALAETSVQVEYLLGGRPPLALGRRCQGLLHRVCQLPPPLCIGVGGDRRLRCRPVVPEVLEVAEQQPIAQEDRVVSHTDTPQSGQHAWPDVRMQPPVLDLVLWVQADDRRYAADAPISSVEGLGAGVCCAHRFIVASPP
jgi:hypothetical protein